MYDMVTVTGGELAQEEINSYVKYLEEKNPARRLKSVNIAVDGEYVELSYELEPVPFERIRRITGYLVGTTDRWNSAKRSEEQDRVKHSTTAE